MSIFSDNPVLQREVRGRTRLRRLGGGRAGQWTAGAVGLLILYFYARGLSGIGRGNPQDARELFWLIVMGLLLLVVILAPSLTATAITQEREQQTWETLTTTRLSGGEVLVGKWLARQIPIGLLLLIVLPLLLSCAVKAGIGPLAAPCCLLFLMLTTACYSTLGLLCSFAARKTSVATASALAVSVALCLGTAIANSVLQLFRFSAPGYGGGYREETALMWINPFYALPILIGALDQRSVTSFGVPEPRAAAILFVYVLSALLVIALGLSSMILRYRSAVRER